MLSNVQVLLQDKMFKLARRLVKSVVTFHSLAASTGTDVLDCVGDDIVTVNAFLSVFTYQTGGSASQTRVPELSGPVISPSHCTGKINIGN